MNCRSNKKILKKFPEEGIPEEIYEGDSEQTREISQENPKEDQ